METLWSPSRVTSAVLPSGVKATLDGPHFGSPKSTLPAGLTDLPEMVKIDTSPALRLATSARVPARLIEMPAGPGSVSSVATTVGGFDLRSITVSRLSGTVFLGSVGSSLVLAATCASDSSGVTATFCGGPTTLACTMSSPTSFGGETPRSMRLIVSSAGFGGTVLTPLTSTALLSFEDTASCAAAPNEMSDGTRSAASALTRDTSFMNSSPPGLLRWSDPAQPAIARTDATASTPPNGEGRLHDSTNLGFKPPRAAGSAVSPPSRQAAAVRWLLRGVLGALLGGGLGLVHGLERGRLRHRHDVITGIDVMDLAGDAARQIAEQIQRGPADLVDRDGAPQRRMAVLEIEHQPRLGDAGAGERAHRPGRNGVDADAGRAEIRCEVAHRGLQRGFRDPHHVVVRHHPGRAAVGGREHRAAGSHQPRRALGDLGEGEAGDHHGADEILARGVGIAAPELVAVGKRDRVHQEIQLLPAAGHLGEHQVDGAQVLDVARQDQARAERFRERPHALAERVALVGEGQDGALAGQSFGNSPGDRVVVGDPHDQPALALHQLTHARPSSIARAPRPAELRNPAA